MLTGTVETLACTLGMWTPGIPEIVIILLALLLLFGGKKLPELARGLGKGLRTFKRELQAEDDDEDEGTSSQATEVKKDQDQQPPDESRQT